MDKEKKKNILIGILLFIIVVLTIVIIILCVKKPEEKTITGVITKVGSNYVILESENEEYLIRTEETEYQLGDNLEVVLKKYNEKESPIEVVKSEIKKAEKNSGASGAGIIPLPEEPPKEEVREEIEAVQTNENKTSNIPSTTTNTENQNETSKDEQVLSYLSETEDVLSKESASDTLKSSFITIVDFLFYNGTIKGVAFDEISSKTKLQVIKIALKLDSSIEKYFPGYKESISKTGSKIYTTIKEKAITLYLNITAKICSNYEDTCVQAKQDFQDMKTSFNLTWTFIKNLAKEGVANIKEWYEIWSGK